MFVTLA